MVTYLKEGVSDELEEFKLYYRNQEIDLLKLNGTRPTLTFTNALMTFVVKPKGDNESYAEINVVSTKNGQAKKLSAHGMRNKNGILGVGILTPIIPAMFLER